MNNPENLAKLLTRELCVLELDMMASDDGQKKACATPAIIRDIITSGMDCANVKMYTDRVLRIIPIDNNLELLNLSSRIPTRIGMNM